MFIFILDIVCKSYSYIIYLEFVLTFKVYRQLALIGFALYCNGCVGVSGEWSDGDNDACAM